MKKSNLFILCVALGTTAALSACGVVGTDVAVGPDGSTSIGITTGGTYTPYYSPYWHYWNPGPTYYPAGNIYPRPWRRPWAHRVYPVRVVPSSPLPSPSGSNPGIVRPGTGSTIVPVSGNVPNINGSNPGIQAPPAGSGIRENR